MSKPTKPATNRLISTSSSFVPIVARCAQCARAATLAVSKHCAGDPPVLAGQAFQADGWICIRDPGERWLCPRCWQLLVGVRGVDDAVAAALLERGRARTIAVCP